MLKIFLVFSKSHHDQLCTSMDCFAEAKT